MLQYLTVGTWISDLSMFSGSTTFSGSAAFSASTTFSKLTTTSGLATFSASTSISSLAMFSGLATFSKIRNEADSQVSSTIVSYQELSSYKLRFFCFQTSKRSRETIKSGVSSIIVSYRELSSCILQFSVSRLPEDQERQSRHLSPRCPMRPTVRSEFNNNIIPNFPHIYYVFLFPDFQKINIEEAAFCKV